MLTFLFALAAIWTLFWLVMLLLDWGDRTPLTNAKTLCAACATTMSGSASNSRTSAQTATANKNSAGAAANARAKDAQQAYAKEQAARDAREEEIEARVKAARKEAQAEAARQANSSAQNSAVKKPVADKHDQANVKPLFVAPNEKDDLKEIKGIGVVMEKTLNDLGITSFKQLAGFKQAEIKMVSEALDASNSGFGDRISRDEWVDQAKVLTRKAS